MIMGQHASFVLHCCQLSFSCDDVFPFVANAISNNENKNAQHSPQHEQQIEFQSKCFLCTISCHLGFLCQLIFLHRLHQVACLPFGAENNWFSQCIIVAGCQGQHVQVFVDNEH